MVFAADTAGKALQSKSTSVTLAAEYPASAGAVAKDRSAHGVTEASFLSIVLSSMDLT